MKESDIGSLGLSRVYDIAWGHADYDGEVSRATEDVPEELLDDAKEREVLVRSDGILEAMGMRAYKELSDTFVGNGAAPFLKGFLEAYLDGQGAYVGDEGLLAALKKFN